MHLFIFDIDGTLIENSKFDREYYSLAMEEVFDIKGPESDEGFTYGTDSGVLVEHLEREQNRTVTEKEEAIFRDRYLELIMDYLDEHPEGCAAQKGALDLFGALNQSKDHMVAIATGGYGPKAIFKLANAGFHTERTVFASADDHFDRVEIILKARERAEDRFGDEAGFESVTYVGDSPWDKLATESLGWRFIGVGDRVKEVENHIDDFVDTDSLFFL